MDFNLIKKNMDSEEGQKLLSELNKLHLDCDETSWCLQCLERKYLIKSLEYKEFLGYELSDDEKVQCESAKKDLADWCVD